MAEDKCGYWDCVHNHKGMCDVFPTFIDCDKRVILSKLLDISAQISSIRDQVLGLEVQNQKSEEDFIRDSRKYLNHDRHNQVWHLCKEGVIRIYPTSLCSCCHPKDPEKQDFNPLHRIKYLTTKLLKAKQKKEDNG